MQAEKQAQKKTEELVVSKPFDSIARQLHARGYDESDAVLRKGNSNAVYIYKKLVPGEKVGDFPHRDDKFDHRNWVEITQLKEGGFRITSSRPELLAQLKSELEPNVKLAAIPKKTK